MSLEKGFPPTHSATSGFPWICKKSRLMTSLLEIIMRSKAIARKFNQGEYGDISLKMIFKRLEGVGFTLK